MIYKGRKLPSETKTTIINEYMKIFEIFLNPEEKEETIFKTFFYKPSNIYEKRKGNLYLAGQLQNTLPQNRRLLDNLSQVIKTGFYGSRGSSPEKSLKQALKKANQFLKELAKKGNVNWISNLNLIVLNIKDFDLRFTRVGTFEILLSRENELLNIGQKLKLTSEPYPLEIFGNIASGKLAENDRIMIASKKAFEFFEENELSQKMTSQEISETKEIKKILASKIDRLIGVSGISVLLIIDDQKQEKGERIILEKRENIFDKIKKLIKRIHFPKLPKVHLSVPKIKVPLPCLKKSLPTLKMSYKKTLFNKLDSIKIHIGKIKSFKPLPIIKKATKQGTETLLSFRKNAILIIGLTLALAIGFFLSEFEQEHRQKELHESLIRIEEKIDKAEAFLILKNEENANILLKEAWDEIGPLSKIYPSFENEILPLKRKIEENLFELNKIKEIADPILVFEADRDKLVPQGIIAKEDTIYLFSPHLNKVLRIKERQEEFLKENFKPTQAVVIGDDLYFLSESNEIFLLKDDEWQESQALPPLTENFSFDCMASFGSNLYFLSVQSEEIAKYSKNRDGSWKKPFSWFKTKTPHSFLNTGSMAIDGNIWITDRTSIHQYFRGDLIKTIDPDIFPLVEAFSKIQTFPGIDYLFVLESKQNRLIVLDKTGILVSQIRSDRFNNLKDFTLSGDREKIYLLDNQKVYEIPFDCLF